MKMTKYMMSGALALIALAVALMANHDRAQAQCAPAATAGDDTVNCTGLSGSSYNALDGNDLIINNGDINSSLIFANNGNDTFISNGDFNTSSIFGGDGDNSISSTGNFNNNSNIFGGSNADSISSTGNFNSSNIFAGDGDNSINVTGNFNNNSNIFGGNDTDNISVSGIFSNNSNIFSGAGNDIITLLPGTTFDGTGYIDGESNTDLLILYSSVELPSKFPQCQGQSGLAAVQAAGCVLPLEGGLLYFTNFENIQVILLQIIGVAMDIPARPQVICDDGRVKVFKLPNGDVEYYSGFDRVNIPNGFMVAKVTLLDLSNGIRDFPTTAQTPNPLGWSVKITQTGNALSGQVYDENGNPVGNSCKH
jgi:hypothetical protein